jgi:hypothetical protein
VTRDPLEHEVTLSLASGATLKILYFSDREQRWIFSYNYLGDKRPGRDPDIINNVKLTAEYKDGLLSPTLVLSMHIIVPERLGKQHFAGVDISPGAKTYLEFHYKQYKNAALQSVDYRLFEVCKGARDRVQLGIDEPAIVRPIEFPFPVPDRTEVKFGRVAVPFRTNADEIAHFDLPTRTLR